ncbi:hypothetical protein PWT90_00928 [Aphanocladium album]|nr:hypothetical protein PWT90_00928 [Aphanocladium album]
MKLTLVVSLVLASLIAATPAPNTTPVELIDARMPAIHCMCLIYGGDGEPVPCDCNKPGSFPAEAIQAEKRYGSAEPLEARQGYPPPTCRCIIDDGHGGIVPCPCDTTGAFVTVKKSLTPQQCMCIIEGGDGQPVPCNCGIKGSK